MAFEPVPFYFTDQGFGSLHDGAGLPVNSEVGGDTSVGGEHYLDSGCWGGT